MPQISDMHFQIALTFDMWPVFVEFCSASSKGRWRKKERRRMAVKPKSADNYVGRPNNNSSKASCVALHTLYE